jgi:hypothetical protein
MRGSVCAAAQVIRAVRICLTRAERSVNWASGQLGCRQWPAGVCRASASGAGDPSERPAVIARISETGHADFPHPAFSCVIKPSRSAGPCGVSARRIGRVSRRELVRILAVSGAHLSAASHQPALKRPLDIPLHQLVGRKDRPLVG